MAEQRDDGRPIPRGRPRPVLPGPQRGRADTQFLSNFVLPAFGLQPATLQMLGERCRRAWLWRHWNC